MSKAEELATDLVPLFTNGVLELQDVAECAAELLRLDAVDRELEALKAAIGEPVSGWCQFTSETHWAPCTVEHVALVKSNHAAWPGYEVGYLYAIKETK
jgi:hypothetical protein